MVAFLRPLSYNERNILDVIEKLIARKNMVNEQNKVVPVEFVDESITAIDLEGAPLFFYKHQKQEIVTTVDPEPEHVGEDQNADKRQTSFKNCTMPYASLEGLVACCALFEGNKMQFASFAGTDLRYARFENNQMTGVDFADADLEHAEFCIEPSLLNASFKNVYTFKNVRFYVIKDDHRVPVTGVTVNENGQLVPERGTSTSTAFDTAAGKIVSFADIYDELKGQADEAVKLTAQKLRDAQKSGDLPVLTGPMQKFLALHETPAPAATNRKNRGTPEPV